MTRKRRRKRRPRCYGWVLKLPRDHPELGPLSYLGSQGLGYMHQLAQDGHERKMRALEDGFASEPLTVQELAEDEGVASVAVYTAIKQARVDLFGHELSDSAIYRRLARLREQDGARERECAIEGCENKLPLGSRSTRRHCEVHAAPAERVRRHRALRKEGAKGDRPAEGEFVLEGPLEKVEAALERGIGAIDAAVAPVDQVAEREEKRWAAKAGPVKVYYRDPVTGEQSERPPEQR